MSFLKFTGFLYARPSFTEGAARIIDLGNTLAEYNSSQSPEEADFLALYSDWAALGEDMSFVIQQRLASLPPKTQQMIKKRKSP